MMFDSMMFPGLPMAVMQFKSLLEIIERVRAAYHGNRQFEIFLYPKGSEVRGGQCRYASAVDKYKDQVL